MKIRIKWYEIILGLFFYAILLGGTFYALDRWIMPEVVRKGSVTEVPDVTGENLHKADSTLRASGFQTAVAGTVSSELPKNYVVSSDPSPGKVVKIGRKVKIYLSGGSLDGAKKEEEETSRPKFP